MDTGTERKKKYLFKKEIYVSLSLSLSLSLKLDKLVSMHNASSNDSS